jgi:hypothetical protein
MLNEIPQSSRDGNEAHSRLSPRALQILSTNLNLCKIILAQKWSKEGGRNARNEFDSRLVRES